MSAMLDYAERATREPIPHETLASFGSTIGFLNSNIIGKTASYNISGDGFPEMMDDLEMLIKLMDFFCRNIPTENSEFLWSNCRQLAAHLEEFMNARGQLNRKEALRVEKCYHRLTAMACVFSFAGDRGLEEALLGEPSHALRAKNYGIIHRR